MVSLVGYTGFVGSNIYIQGKKNIDNVYNSKNIKDAFGTEPDLLIYAGMRAEKYLANANPEADMQQVYEAEGIISKINPKKLVLISTVDIFKNPNYNDEDAEVETEGLLAYGLNRYRLEQWVREKYSDALIIRLPGLYGENIKKNFIYDYINVVPYMLKESKYLELLSRDNELKKYYELQNNGFYKCRDLQKEEKELLKLKFKSLDFTALNFTDSRNTYQFYPLSRLWDDIQKALEKGITLLHPATEPVSAGEVYKYISGHEFVNEISESPVYYDYRTKYAEIFGGNNGYFLSKSEILEDISRFVKGK